jgi:hypothetical protein
MKVQLERSKKTTGVRDLINGVGDLLKGGMDFIRGTVESVGSTLSAVVNLTAATYDRIQKFAFSEVAKTHEDEILVEKNNKLADEYGSAAEKRLENAKNDVITALNELKTDYTNGAIHMAKGSYEVGRGTLKVSKTAVHAGKKRVEKFSSKIKNRKTKDREFGRRSGFLNVLSNIVPSLD